MNSLKSFKHLPTASGAITGDQLARQWKTQAKRTRFTSTEPNYPRMLSEAAKLMVKSHKRLMKLAPRLFDSEVIDREAHIRLFTFLEWVKAEAEIRKRTGKPSPGSEKWDILGKAPNPIAAACEWIRTMITEEAWKALSPHQISEIRIEWKISTLAEAITENLLHDDLLRANADHIRLKHIIDLSTASLDLGDLCLRWTVPRDISRLETAPSSSLPGSDSSQPAAPFSETSPKAASRSAKIILLSNYLSAIEQNKPRSQSSSGYPAAEVAV